MSPHSLNTTGSTGKITGAEARHQVANLLHRYTEIADRKDIPAVLELLGDTIVTFPTDGYHRAEDAEAFFRRLWRGDVAHRHDVSNLVVEPAGPGNWHATAHYTRYVFTPDPVLATLGEYALRVRQDGQDWTVTDLTVTRTWST
jgi:hypothetical protein